MRGLLFDQISSVIAYNKSGLLDLFRKLEIKTSANPTNKELTILLINNIKSNQKLQIGLAYLIAEQNNLLQEQAKSKRSDNFSGNDDKKQKPKRDFKETADVVTSISNSIKVVADTITNINAGKVQSDLETQVNSKSPEQIQLEEQQSEQTQREAERKKKRKRNIVIGVVVVAIAVGVFVAYKKGVFKNKIDVEP
jgi:hypothetical protein